MPDTPASIRIAAAGCVTPFGDAVRTYSALMRGESALRAVPVRGRDGGDLVPLALLPGRDLDETAPPAWMDAVRGLAGCLPAGEWGTASRPVFVTGSNFGVGGLYALRRTGDKAFGVWGAPPTCTEELRRSLGWGSNVSIISLACVSAHLGLL
ncbi:MAG TPA: hypothetical protein VFE25_14055, partial [Opitutaceae bacterium]|nr:hypothetical protein [Opitutaceae bacterium]